MSTIASSIVDIVLQTPVFSNLPPLSKPPLCNSAAEVGKFSTQWEGELDFPLSSGREKREEKKEKGRGKGNGPTSLTSYDSHISIESSESRTASMSNIFSKKDDYLL